MDIFAGIATVATSPALLFWIVAAALIGMVVGAIPGLTAAAAIAMLLPVTYYMDPLSALAFLYVIGKSGRYGGSVAAILFNTPGTAASAATQLDGYPLSRQGKSGKAMKIATISSVIGDFIGDLLLIVFVGYIARIALTMGPPELFAVYFAAFVVIGSVIGQSVTKGLASAALGIVLATVGLDPITSQDRMTLGLFDLSGGVSLVPLMIGIFVLGEVFTQLESKPAAVQAFSEPHDQGAAARNHLGWAEFRRCFPHIVRSSFIGAFIGMLPGLGSAIASFVAYGEGKRRARNPEEWGKGALEGVAAPEAANNAVSGPSMAPLLTLGIPGSTIGAILIGVFLIHGIQIGPTLFLTSRELVYSLFAAGLFGIASYGLIGYFGAARVGHLILKIPTRVLYPLIFLTAFVSAYSANGSLFDVAVMIAAGVLGWLMRKFDFNPAALVISFVLAGGAEEALRQSLRLSDSGLMIFLERPIAAAFLLLGVLAMFFRARSLRRATTSSIKEAS
ncbi:tripartite tricarboxylate transporter permease [Paracoccus sp. Z330]|uniref:Tripartite tricarboxylate transporter permease n=1 Tax=Paracoccus onchidii TaxID=3017813 RepID=A0ABT4ZJL6_9RHOB|nr:tripartite tricarboxylate transporter permease [Paracoccus onchidii]MDB6179508.1 tripartite tricarboxylate transporter permease [Paracoccus onchidii]